MWLFYLQRSFVSIDTETTSTDAISAELVGLSFSAEESKAFYVPVPANYEEALKVVQIFKPLYESDKIMKIGQNIKYDYEVLSNYGVTLKGKMFDTMIAHYLIQPELHHNMDYMAETLLGYQTIHIEELLGPKGRSRRICATSPLLISMSMLRRTPTSLCSWKTYLNHV